MALIKFLVRTVAVLAIGIGTGVLIWGISAAALQEPIRSPVDYFDIGFLISAPSEAIGWGAGFLAAGITAIVLSAACCRSGR